MFKINDDLSIYVTRGDAVAFNLSATIDNGETYLFKPNDIVRINIMEKKGCDEVVFQKGFKVEEETETVEINLTGDETKIGDIISKPTDYWYEIELNPFTNPKTIIGYDDESGAKIFKLFPEGEDADGITEEDIPIVDTELDLASDRPVQNQAIAYAVTNVINEVNATVNSTIDEVALMVDGVMEELKNVPNVDNIKRLQDSMNEHLEATDPHNIEDGLINKQVAEEVATDDKVLVVVDGEIKKTNVENIGVREIEGSTDVADAWKAMSGLDTANTRTDVTYGDGKYVCVGQTGRASYSIDGKTWSDMTGLTSKAYHGVTYGNGRFVCVGDSGLSYYSTDGKTWVAMTGLDTSKAYRSVAYGNGKFVCVGDGGTSYYSTDGLTWAAMTGLESRDYFGVTYGNDRFVCVGYAGSSSYSTDGLTWVAMTGLDTSKSYSAVTYGDGKFVCAGLSGLSYYSTDGLTWQAMSGLDTSKHYYGVAYGNGGFVCVGSAGSSSYSTDGVTWQAINGLDTSKIYRAVTYGTEFVCVGYSGVSHHNALNPETLQSTLQVAGTLLLTKLYASQTTVTITDDAITTDSTFDIYTDKYGVNPKNVSVDSGSITLEFKPQETDVNIKVVVK
jgi:hypothetical protein